MAILQLTIIPMGTGNCSVGHYVAALQGKLRQMKVPFVMTDMGTILEGDASQLLDLVKRLYETPFDDGAVRVVTQISIDDRRDKKVKIGDKIRSITSQTEEEK